MSNVGRKQGIRSQKYEEAIKEFMLGKGSVSEIALKYGIDRSGLNRAINSTKNSTKNELSGKALKDYVAETKANILNGISNLETLKNSTEKIHNDLADDIMEELRMSNLKTAKFIHALGQRLLKDLLETTNSLREQNLMDLKNLNSSFKALETANNVLGIQKNPIVAIQNNIQNNSNLNNINATDDKKELKIEVEVIESKKDDFIDVEVKNEGS